MACGNSLGNARRSGRKHDIYGIRIYLLCPYKVKSLRILAEIKDIFIDEDLTVESELTRLLTGLAVTDHDARIKCLEYQFRPHGGHLFVDRDIEASRIYASEESRHALRCLFHKYDDRLVRISLICKTGTDTPARIIDFPECHRPSFRILISDLIGNFLYRRLEILKNIS